MNYFPIFTRLSDKRVLVVGAGSVACRKITLLLKAHATITVIAPDCHQQVADWDQMGRIDYQQRHFTTQDVEQHWLVIAATNNETVNQHICEAAASRYIFTNVVDDRKRSEFITPAIVDRNPIQIAISSGGDAPVLARSIKMDLEKKLPEKLGLLAKQMGAWRDRVVDAIPAIDRRAFWEQLLDSSIPEQLYQGDTAEDDFQQLLIDRSTYTPKGQISLAHIFSADPELLTLKTLQHMQHADTVFYETGIDESIIEHIRRDADRIHIGNKAGAQSIEEQKFEQAMTTLAQDGQRVMLLSNKNTEALQERIHQSVMAAHFNFTFIPGINGGA